MLTPVFRARYAYASGDFGLNFYWQGAAFFLLFFYTDILQLPSTAAGIIYALGGLVDGMADPVMGLIAERTRTRRGRYRPYLLWGAVPLALSFVALFALPLMAGAPGLVIAAAVAGHIIFRLLYTVVSIPYSALGACLTFDPQERTRLAGARMVFGALGGISVVSMITLLREALGDQTGIVVGAMVSGIIAVALLLVTVSFTRERSPCAGREEMNDQQDLAIAPGPIVTLRAMFANGPFLRLSHAIFAITIANMIVVKTVLYRYEHIFDAPAVGGEALLVMTAVPLVSIPLWVQIYLRLEKRAAFVLGCLCVVASSLVLAAVGQQSPYGSLVAYGLIAGSFSAFAVGFWSILPDTIDHGHARTGVRAESSLVGLASAIQKIAIALSGLGLGIALDMIGYVGGVEQSAGVQERLHWVASLTPAVFGGLGLLIFFGYSITKKRHADSLRLIETRNAEAT